MISIRINFCEKVTCPLPPVLLGLTPHQLQMNVELCQLYFDSMPQIYKFRIFIILKDKDIFNFNWIERWGWSCQNDILEHKKLY